MKNPIYNTLPNMLAECCKKYPSNIAYSNMGTNLSYESLLKHSQSIRTYLLDELHLKSSDRVAVMLPNCIQQPVCVFGILISGLCVVNINPLYTASELHHQLKNSGAKAIFVLENMAHIVEKAIQGTDVKHVIISKLGDMHSTVKRNLINFLVKYIKRMVPSYKLKGAQSLLEILKRPPSLKSPRTKPSDLAFIQYTGGTTGVAKGAILSHSNICWNITQARSIVPEGLYQDKTTILTALPLYHIFSLIVSYVTLTYGGKNLLVTNPRDIPSLVKTIKSEPVHGIPTLNTLMLHMINNKDFGTIDFSHLRATIAGGMSTQSRIAKQWQKITGCVVNEGYGLSETSPIISLSENHRSFSGNVGKPAPNTEVRVVNSTGEVLGFDIAGELEVKGPQVMRGYWKIEANDNDNPFSEDGWFKTGDIASVSANGHIKILDRLKDMIIVGGFNVYPSEVEDIITHHPDVLECGVISHVDENKNESVKAIIVKKNPSLRAIDIQNYCYEHLTHYKVPKHIEFSKVLPKSPIGKILRRKLKS